MILGILLFIAFSGGVVALVKHSNRPVRSGKAGGSRSGGGKSPGRGRPGSAGSYQSGRPSWALKAWNASGAPKTSETTLKGAAAVVTGKAAGAVSRGGWRVSKRLGRGGVWFGNTALKPFDRWLERKRAGLEAAAGTPVPDKPANDDLVHEDVIHEPASPPSPGKTPDRELNEFKLATKEKWLKDMVAAYERLCAEGLVGPEAAAEHMISRGRLEYEIEELRRALNPDPKPEPAASPPPVFIHSNRNPKGNRMDTYTRPTRPNPAAKHELAGAPATLMPHVQFIAEFQPEDDAELLNMLAAEVQGALAYAEALGQMFENCVTGTGLDPAAMQGISDYAEAHAENADRVQAAHKQFLAVYEAIIEAASNGTQMPYNGRFFSGESAA